MKSFDTLEEDADAFAQANGSDWWSLCFALDADKIEALAGTFFEWLNFDYSGDKIFLEIF